MSVTDPDQHFLTVVADHIQRNHEVPQRTSQQLLHWFCCHRADLIAARLIHDFGPVVQTGPFAGMKYVSRSVGSVLPPKLLGCHEAELHGVLAHVARGSYRRVINIGCGEGYYAIGLARLLPSARITAFDADPAAQTLCRDLAALNGIGDRVAVRGECRHEHLRESADGPTFVFCDCEGGEQRLLDPDAVPQLLACDILIELHEFLDPALPQTIVNRFAATHSAIHIGHTGRDPNALPALRELCQLDQWLAVWEGRPGPTPWVFLRPHWTAAVPG